MESLVSIIIPHYNRSDLLEQTIFSVKAQTYKQWEIIIVDDSSNNDEYERILKHKSLNNNITIIQRKSSISGPSVCRNEGLKIARGEYVIFLDSDDILAPFCLENRLDQMKSNPDLDFAVFNIEKFRDTPGDIDELFSIHPSDKDDYLKMFLRLNIAWQVMAPIWKKNALLLLNGFNEKMNYAEDPELHTRALLNSSLKYKVYKNDRPDCYYRLNSSPELKKSVNGRIQFVMSIHKAINKINGLSTLKKKQLIKSLNKAYKNIVTLFLTDNSENLYRDFNLISCYCVEHKIINWYQFQFSKIIVKLWQKNFQINKVLHLKGLLTRFYLFST